MPTDTTKAPAPLSTARRENVESLVHLGHGGLPQPIIVGGALDRAQDAHVRAAAALEPFQRLLDLRLGRLLVVAQERRGGHDPAVDAVAALRHLLLDIGGLQRVRLLGRAEARQRHDLGVADRRQRRDAGADRLAVEMHGAGAALREPAAELRIVEPDVVLQRIEQRHVGIGVDRVRPCRSRRDLFEPWVHLSLMIDIGRSMAVAHRLPLATAHAAFANCSSSKANPTALCWKLPRPRNLGFVVPP